MTIAVVVLSQGGVPLARKVMASLPDAILYGLKGRTTGVDISYIHFGETLRQLFQAGIPILGVCAAGILIRTLAPLLNSKWQEPPVLAIAEDGSAVVPLLGGLQGANDLARQVAAGLQIVAAITTSGDLRFQTALLAPPPGYRLANPDDAKSFIADLLAGATVRLVGQAPWLENSRLPFATEGELTIRVISKTDVSFDAEQQECLDCQPGRDCLVYYCDNQLNPSEPQPNSKKLAIVGIGPGSSAWLSPEVKTILQTASDWVGYKTYLDLAEPWRLPHTQRHESDNRVELDRARQALDLAATGRSVVLMSSGDPGIYGMAAALFEVLDQEAQPAWQDVEIQVCPGISAMQAAAAQIGAPLGHDFCVISLSNILKPWEVIAQRLTAAAQADFAIAIYNPLSQQRTWQLEQARTLLLQWRSPQTPVVLARNLGRPGQTVTVKPLVQLVTEDADMRTVILIGSSQTRIVQQSNGKQWVYTPRHY